MLILDVRGHHIVGTGSATIGHVDLTIAVISVEVVHDLVEGSRHHTHAIQAHPLVVSKGVLEVLQVATELSSSSCRCLVEASAISFQYFANSRASWLGPRLWLLPAGLPSCHLSLHNRMNHAGCSGGSSRPIPLPVRVGWLGGLAGLTWVAWLCLGKS